MNRKRRTGRSSAGQIFPTTTPCQGIAALSAQVMDDEIVIPFVVSSRRLRIAVNDEFSASDSFCENLPSVSTPWSWLGISVRKSSGQYGGLRFIGVFLKVMARSSALSVTA